MKTGYHAIFFFQSLNLVPRGYIILDRTHSVQEILADLPENLQKLSVYKKFYHPGNLTKKPGILFCKCIETFIQKEYGGSTMILSLKRIKG